MLLLKKIQLTNFLSHEKTTVEFKENQQLLIDGKSGAGKSTIIDALVWSLYGRGRSNNRSMIKKGKKRTQVLLFFKKDDVEYKIDRSADASGRQTLKISSRVEGVFKHIKESGLKRLQEEIEKEIIGATYLLFINSVVYPQDNVENFVKQSANKRKEILLEIIGTENYREYYKKTHQELTERDKKESNIENTIENIKESNKENALLVKGLVTLEVKEKELSLKRDKILKEVDVLSERISENEDKNKDIEEKEREIGTINQEISNIEDNLIILKDKLSSIESVKAFDLDDITKEIEKIKEDMKKKDSWNEQMMKLIKEAPILPDFDIEIANINKELISVINTKVQICPDLNKECPVLIRENEAKIKLLEDRLKEVNSNKQDNIKDINIYEDKVKELGECPVVDHSRLTYLENEREKANRMEQDKIRLKEDIENKTKELKIKADDLKKAFELLGDRKKINTDKDKTEFSRLGVESVDLYGDIREISEKISVAKKSKERFDENVSKLEEKKKELKKCKEDTESLKLLKDAFSPKGLEAIIVDYIIPRLEDKINKILSELSDFRIRLDTQKDGLTEDTVLEGLFISIFNESGEEFDFDNYSGSEKLRVMYAVSEGLASIQKCGFRILDELITGLDKETEEKFINIILTLKENVNQLICISHIRSVKDLFNESILINKTGNTSVIN